MAAQGTAESLYTDPTSVYQPALNTLEQERIAASKRYETNAADIKNIFGNLSTVAVEDAARIKQQFTETIAQQQASLAARTAEARMAQTASETAIAKTANERGNGPATGFNPVAIAREKGIAESNAYQTIWQGLQGVNQAQALQNVSARGASYGQQQVDALANLKSNLDATLAGIASKKSDIQSQLAQAKLSSKQDVKKAQYNENLQAKSDAKAAAIAAAEAAGKVPTFEKTPVGFAQKANYYGVDGDAIAKQTDKWINALEKKGFNDKYQRPISRAMIKALWAKTYPAEYEQMGPLVDEYINNYTGLTK